MQNINKVLENNPLAKLVQKDNFVGWIYSLDYDTAFVMTNDLWKSQALSIPHNSFLIATAFDPNEFSKANIDEQEVILLRVVSSAKLPQDDDLIRTKIDTRQEQTSIRSSEQDFDDLTRNQMQFGGLKCRVLGTFFTRENDLWLGSDLESFSAATTLAVYRPRGTALQTIVNHMDPIRKKTAIEEAALLGIKKSIQPFQIGTVRYTSTDRIHRQNENEKVPVCVQPSDFLAHRTAVLGMTRTGKSNMIKQMVAVVKKVADEGEIKIGQIIYDINGEYANANQQDKGSIADVFPNQTKRYRMLKTPGFEDLRNNFYEQLNEGFSLIKRELEDANRLTTDYVRAFANMSLDEPDAKEIGEHTRWERIVAAYKVLLYKAGLTPPLGIKIKFTVSNQVQSRITNQMQQTAPNPNNGISLQDAAAWFEAAREANLQALLPSSTAGRNWVDDTLQNLLDMIAQKRGNSNYISGHRILADAVKYHTPNRSSEVADEIYKHLIDGKIVILDLSVGDSTMREKVSKQIASRIFQASMQKFIEGRTPPNIVVYIEEAHNLLGKDLELTETWPRLAKEGAKYRIALVYATQEVSSVHPNILANTENWFVTHLNNEREIRELSRFYDFEDFSRSLIRAQDVGFARVKTLSGPFVIPVQIDKFNPEEEKEKLGRLF